AKFYLSDEFPSEISGVGEVNADYLPNGEEIKLGNKWTLAKNATVAYKKDRTSGEYDWVVNNGKNDPAKTNYSNLKLTYTAKKGTFKGSFKVYALNTSGKTPKMKKVTVNVTGMMVDGVGYGSASVKKPSIACPVIIK
ncbi:MAG: hypothetical protein ILO34_03585, partial [Kiritimatiellae bacterium]|nr:hypothetical protein [Kiritimatiellia bacterium]